MDWLYKWSNNFYHIRFILAFAVYSISTVPIETETETEKQKKNMLYEVE